MKLNRKMVCLWLSVLLTVVGVYPGSMVSYAESAATEQLVAVAGETMETSTTTGTFTEQVPVLSHDVTIEVLDSQGSPIRGVSIKYQTSSWYDAGQTNQNGKVSIEIPEKFSTITARAEYEGGRTDIRQNIEEDASIVFRTVNVNVRLEDSEGQGLDGGAIQYCRSSWKTYGETDNNGNREKELLPGTYTFRMKYENGQQDIKQDITEDSTVVFETLKVNTRLVNSEGQGLEGGSIIYCRSSWGDYGVTDADGNSYREMLPGTYAFRMKYENGQQDIKQNITEDPTVVFETLKVNTRLVNSEGGGLEGGSIIYCRSSWGDYGVTDARGNSFREMLPGTYSFRMKYALGQQDIKQNIVENPEVLFQTYPLTVLCLDQAGEGIEGIQLRYSRANWGDFGYTDSVGASIKELLPSTYNVRAYLPEGYTDQRITLVEADVLEFRTETPVETYTLNVVASPAEGGVVNLSPSQSTYASGTTVTLTTVASEGYVFDHIETATGEAFTGNQITMTEDTLLTVYFTPEVMPEELTLQTSVYPEEGGSVDVSPLKETYAYGDVVTLTAQASEGYTFEGFTGHGIESELTLTMAEDLTIQAVFKETGAPDTVIVHNIAELNQAETLAKNGNITILVADGTYELPDQFVIRGDHVTIRSLSGNADQVVIKGKGMDGGVPHVFAVYADDFTLEDVTIGWVHNHGIQVHGETDADNLIVRNVHFRDTREQMLKVSFSQEVDAYSDNGLVENCTFEYTAGIAPQWYVGGVDAHHAKNWVIRNNAFKHITSPENSLAEGAIHFWSDSENTLVEGNVIIDCGRGILFGLDNVHHYDGIIRNNFIHVVRDAGIYLANADGVQVYNNTVFVDSDYMNAIEYRFEDTNALIWNNLTNKAITARNGGTADLASNIKNASEAWFMDAAAGDLHLKSAIYAVIDQGIDIEGLTVDIDGESREAGKVDIGADEASGLEVRQVVSLVVETDKDEIYANGKDTLTIEVQATYEDGETASIEADRLVVTDPDGVESILPEASFSSYTAGTYTLQAFAQKVVSPAVTIEVIEEDLTQLQPTELELYHKDGQTFITFEEIIQLVQSEVITSKELHTLIKNYERDIKYRIYYSNQPITVIEQMEPIAEVDALSGWDKTFYGISSANKSDPAYRYVIQDGGAPLGLSTGLYVHNADVAGEGFYAVTSVVDGIENTALTDGVNTGSIHETTGQGTPVLQRVVEAELFQWVKDVKLYYFTRWEVPPNASIEGMAFDYLVAEPSNLANPAPVGIHMHCWGGNLNGGYGWWNDAEDGALMLASNEEPYDWWTGYSENYYDEGGSSRLQNSVVRPYSTNRLWSFVDWMESSGSWNIDRSRTFSAGSSMGGSGSIMMAIRFPEQIAWNRSWVGVHDPNNSPSFTNSYAGVYGKQEYANLFEDGTPVWDYYNDVWYLQNHIEDSVGFISFANGKNDGAIGWEQAVDFINALQETRQPHLFIWGQGGHSQRTVLPGNGSQRVMMLDIRVDQSLPAFTHCSLDDVFGNGDPNDGDDVGQVNRYLYWETEDIVDTESSWEMTVGLMDASPEDTCLVDITPRRLQTFKPAIGSEVVYENYDVDTGELIDSGTVIVDVYGLITIPQTTVGKTMNRIIVKK